MNTAKQKQLKKRFEKRFGTINRYGIRCVGKGFTKDGAVWGGIGTDSVWEFFKPYLKNKES